MSLVSNLFLLFVAASVLVYYIVPHRFQWIVLLAFSYIYYIAGGPRYVIFILFSTVVTWLTALFIEKTEEKGNHKGARRLLILDIFWMSTGKGVKQKSSPLNTPCLCLSFHRSFKDQLEGTAVWHSSSMRPISLTEPILPVDFSGSSGAFSKK